MNYKKLNWFIFAFFIASTFICVTEVKRNYDIEKMDPTMEAVATIREEYSSGARISVLSKDEASEKISAGESRKEEESRKEAAKLTTEVKSAYERNDTAAKTGSDGGGMSDNAFYLAAVVCQEAGGESEYIQMLVANVVMNRVASRHFPNSIYGVITARCQYGMMWKYGVRFPSWADSKTIERCYAVANRILSGERVCPASVVYQAEFVQGSGVYAAYDGFYFCYE